MHHVLETDRLLLRELTIADLDFVAAMLGHPEVMRYWPRCQSREEAAAGIQKQLDRYARDGCGYWLMLDRSTRATLGQAGVMMLEIDGVREAGLGYMVLPEFWNQGYATEAARACIDFTFNTLDLPRVIAPMRPENTPSLAVAHRLGMTLEKTTEYSGFTHHIFVALRGELGDS